MSIDRRIREWTETIALFGDAVVTVVQNRHLKFRLASGRTFILSKTPTDWRNDLNALRELKHLLGWEKPTVEARQPARTARPTRLPTKPASEARTPFIPPPVPPDVQLRRRRRLGLENPPPQPRVRLNRPTLHLPGRAP